MNRVMKRMFMSMMLLAITAIWFTSCDQKMRELEEQVDNFNNECPISFGDIMTLNSVALVDGTVEMKFTANETIASISALNNHKEEAKESLCMSLTKEAYKHFVDKIIAAEANIKVIIVGQQSNKRAEILLTTEDLEKGLEKYANMSESQKLVASNVIGMKIKLPLQIDAITKLVGLSLTDDALIYKYEINDAEIGQDIDNIISFIKSTTLGQMAQGINNGVMGTKNQQFFKALIECNQGIECEYYELRTGKRAIFRISTNEIQEVLNGKYDSQPTSDDWEKLGTAIDDFENEIDADTVWGDY